MPEYAVPVGGSRCDSTMSPTWIERVVRRPNAGLRFFAEGCGREASVYPDELHGQSPSR